MEKRDDPAFAIDFGNDRRYMHVHRPCQVQRAGGAEFPPRHEDHVIAFRKTFYGVTVQQVAGDGLHIPAVQFRFQPGFAEPGDPDHALVGGRALCHAGEGRAHLSAHAEDDDIAVNGGEIRDQAVIGGGHEILQRIDAVETGGEICRHLVRLTRIVLSDFLDATL